MLKLIVTSFISLSILITNAQTWQDVGGGTNNSSHGMLTWDGKLINLGSYNNPCNRVAEWDGAAWSCLGGGVGIVARAGVVWDGKLVVVGDFWNVQQPCVGCNGVAVWDGVSWSPLGNGVNNDVLSCTVWNNELVIAGDFTQADGVSVARIVKWNGTSWESVGPIGSFGNDIRAMVEFEGDLWVGGDFNNVNGCSPCDGLVKYDPATAGWVGGNSGVDLVGGVNESVRVLYVNPNDGNLYMGGEFPELIDGDVGTQDFNMSGIAMYDGSNWTPLGTGLNEYCRAMHEYNGDIVAGGYFTDAGGTPANKIAKWDGTSWSAMGLGFDASGIDEYVKSAAVWNGIFFAGGAYTQAEGNPMNYIAQWYEAPTDPPVAWMSASSTSLCGSGCIDFLDNSTNAPTTWNWSFPGADITSSTDQDPGSICWSSPGTYTVSLQACNSFGCTTQDIDIEVENGATVTVNDASICGGGPVTLTANPSVSGGTYLWTPGGEVTESISVNPGSSTTYDVTYSYLGCTSSATSTVTVGTGPNVSLTPSSSICEGQSTTITATPSVGGGTYLWTPGGETTASIIVSPLTTTDYTVEYTLNGCASPIETSTVTVGAAYNLTDNINACEGATVTYPDGTNETITASTSHTSNLMSSLGCDSNIVTNVTMESAYSNTESIDLCSGLDYTYPDGTTSTNITANESHTSNLNNVNGCDSTITTNISVLISYDITDNQDICSGSDYTYPDGTTSINITSNESHLSNLPASNGCDSTITTNLTVVTAYNNVENESICSGSNYTYPDGTTSNNVIADESHISNLLSINGCDSIVTSNLTVLPTYNLSESASVCEGSIVTYPDGSSETITSNTSHTSNFLSTDGCDSIIVTNITMLQVFEQIDNITVCIGDDYTYPDGIVSTNIQVDESHVSNFISVDGCDSTYTTNITVTPSVDNTVSESNNVITANQSGATYQWVDCDNGNIAILGEIGQSFTPASNGNYAVEITIGTCSEISACTSITTIGLEEIYSSDFTIYPNPVSDYIQVVTELDVEAFEFKIIDSRGRTLITGNAKNGDKIALPYITTGTYILEINDGEFGRYRFVKK